MVLDDESIAALTLNVELCAAAGWTPGPISGAAAAASNKAIRETGARRAEGWRRDGIRRYARYLTRRIS
jgi:hypothetical protein